MERHLVGRIVTCLIIVGTLLTAGLPWPSGATPVKAAPSHPPVVLDREPAPGEEQPVDAPLIVTFDQEMDHKSVEEAFSIAPDVPVTIGWDGNRMLVQPQLPGFERGQTYRAKLSDQAKSVDGQPLATPLDFRFPVVGYLEVAEVVPASGATEVDVTSTITVIFNRPVVPLTGLDQQGSLPQPLSLSPSVEGKGEWLNTSIYTFKPAEPLAPATLYSARLRGGLEDTQGGVLESDYVWKFTTKLPAVALTVPADKAIYVSPEQSVRVSFNQAMDHQSAEQKFSLRDQRTGEDVTGTYTWSSADVTVESQDPIDTWQTIETVVQGETMVFTPDQPLAMGMTYRARLAMGVMSAGGNKGTTTAYTWSFTTAPPPAVKSTDPKNGDRRADPEGGLSVIFTSPMSTTTLAANLTIIPEPTRVYSYWSDSQTNLSLSWNVRPQTAYTVTLGRNMEGRYGQTLGKDTTVRFTTRKASPDVGLINQGSIGTYNSYTDTMAYVSYRNVSEINYYLYALSLQDFFDLSGDNRWEYWDKFEPDPNDLIRTWSQEVTGPPNEYRIVGTRLSATKQGGLAPGLYFLKVSALGADPAQQVMVVSPYNTILKQSPESSFVWVTDLKTGQVVPDLPVKLYGADGDVLNEGTTDQDGVYQGEYDKVDVWAPMYALVGSEDLPSARFGLVINRWDDGLSPWEFNINGDMYSPAYKTYIYTDRPIYRPGQKVYFKGIIRENDFSTLSLPPTGEPVTVTVSNGQGEEIYSEVLRLNDMGTFNGSLSLSESAGLGYYSLNATPAGSESSYGSSFQVAEYRKPQFEVKVTTDRAEYLQGDEIAVNAKSEYYFGGPVPGAKVHWTVLTEDASFNYAGKDWYDFTDYDWTAGRYYGYYGGVVAEGDGLTDVKGQFTFTVTADIADKINSQKYTIEASVTDTNDQVVSSQASAIVHKGMFYVGVAPQSYVNSAGREAQVNVITVDWDSQPVSGISVTLVYNTHEWFSVQEKSEDGQFYWTSESLDTPILTDTVVTDKDGKAVSTFVPKTGGVYKIVASAQDERENVVRSSTFMWVSGVEFINWRQENNDRIELVADKKSYEIGDTAEVLIPSPYQGEVEAMVTIERGKVVSHELMTLKGNSEKISVPILPGYVPDVFVSVVLVKGQDETNPLGSFKLGYVMLKVSTESKHLKVTLTPDKEQYQPGDIVTYDILATDSDGRGKTAELSLALVDKSVLALADSTQGTMMDAFWAEQGVGVHTASPLVLSVDRKNLEVAAAAKGGGGGGPEGEGTVRRRFPDTAFWVPDVRTDAEGKAQVKVKLPDTLTTWNMRAKAVTADTEVGEAEVDVKSNKPLHVRSVLPRFFVGGDKAQVGAIVHNETDAAFEVVVSLTGKGVQINSKVDKQMVPAHGQVTVRWDITVKDEEVAVLRFSARGAGLEDAEEFTLPILHYTSPETVATSGQVGPGQSATELVQVPLNADDRQGDLTMKLQASLAASTRDSLIYLETYPHMCIEQTVSRFVPNVINYRALQQLDVSNPELEAKLPQYVTVGLQRIYALQHTDGGWGWWSSDPSTPFLTAYVLFGLIQTDRAGFVVEQDVVDSAIKFLQESLERSQAQDIEQPSMDNSRAFVLYVLADAGQGDLGRTVALYRQRNKLSNFGKAFLAMALNILEPDVRSRVDALMSDLNNTAIASATGVHWEEKYVDLWTMNTDTRSTAIILEAYTQIEPESKLSPNIVRWLMANGQNGHWASTQETAWSVMALTDYMVTTGELKASYSYETTLNGKNWVQGTMNADNLQETDIAKVALADLLQDVANQVTITRLPPFGQETGEGKLYYSLFLKYYLPVPDIKALSRGVTLARQYTLVDKPGTPATEAQVGDIIQVKLTIIAPDDLHYVVVEDPLPAGCEALDQSLKTTSVVGERPELKRQGDGNEWEGWGWWWFGQTEVHDSNVSLFATYLPRGTYEYTYLMRASLPGEFQVIPSTGYQMYFPEVFGRSDGGLFTVTPGTD